MDIKSSLVGAGAVVLLVGGAFGAAAMANAGDDTPAPVVTVEATVQAEKVAAPVVTPEPVEVVVPVPAPAVPQVDQSTEAPPVAEAPVQEVVTEDPLPEGNIPAPKADPYANPAGVQPTPPSPDVDQP